MTARPGRCWRHLRQNARSAQRAFPNVVLYRVEQAIERSMRTHTATLHVVIENALPLRAVWRRCTPRARALEVFAGVGAWDTEGNNGVLLYLLLADRAVEIVADRAAAACIHERRWGEICSALSDSCRVGNFETGLLAAIERIDILLAEAFPRTATKAVAGRTVREVAASLPLYEPARVARLAASTRIVLLERRSPAGNDDAPQPLVDSPERVVGLD